MKSTGRYQTPGNNKSRVFPLFLGVALGEHYQRIICLMIRHMSLWAIPKHKQELLSLVIEFSAFLDARAHDNLIHQKQICIRTRHGVIRREKLATPEQRGEANHSLIIREGGYHYSLLRFFPFMFCSIIIILSHPSMEEIIEPLKLWNL